MNALSPPILTHPPKTTHPRQALSEATALDPFLAQADALRPLFVALNDEGVAVRATAVRLVGRLAGWNPAYAAPALRRHLLQLLTDMEHSPDSRWGAGAGAGGGVGGWGRGRGGGGGGWGSLQLVFGSRPARADGGVVALHRRGAGAGGGSF